MKELINGIFGKPPVVTFLRTCAQGSQYKMNIDFVLVVKYLNELPSSYRITLPIASVQLSSPLTSTIRSEKRWEIIQTGGPLQNQVNQVQAPTKVDTDICHLTKAVPLFSEMFRK